MVTRSLLIDGWPTFYIRSITKAASPRVGEEIRQRLERTFADERIDAPTRSLMEAVGRLASLVFLQTMQHWHGHPAAGRVFRRAIDARLTRLGMKNVFENDPRFGPGELPDVRVVMGSDMPNEMGLGLEALDFHAPQMGKQLEGIGFAQREQHPRPLQAGDQS